MRRKKSEPEIENISEELATEEENLEGAQKDIKLGEFQLKENAVLVIKKTNYKGNDRIDFRVWLNSPRYKGPTRQGFALPMDKIDDFVEIVNIMKKRLEESEM